MCDSIHIFYIFSTFSTGQTKVLQQRLGSLGSLRLTAAPGHVLGDVVDTGLRAHVEVPAMAVFGQVRSEMKLGKFIK